MSDNDYFGTLSSIPRRDGRVGLEVVATSAKRERGKVRGNKRDPRTRQTASPCVCYTDNGDGTVTLIRVIEPNQRKSGGTRKTNKRTTVKPTVTEFDKLGELVHSKLTTDEIRARNGL